MSCNEHKLHMINAKVNISKLMESLYVDNCVTSLNIMIEIEEFIKDARYDMLEGAFDLRGWEYTGSRSCKEEIAVLGMIWNK